MCTIHTYIIHKLFINSCNCRTTQCFTTTTMVKWNIPTSLSQNSGPLTPRRQTPEHRLLTLATIAIFLCVRYIRTSSIRYSLTHVTAALPVLSCVLLYITQRKYTYTQNTLSQITTINIHSIQCECFTSKYTQIILSQFTYPNTCVVFQ